MSSERDKIILKGIRFHGYHGTSESERQVGQKYEIDVELICSLDAAGRTDDLEHTVDYAEVVKLIIETGTEKSCHLIEALAERCATSILNRFPIDEVRVTVKKLTPPIKHPLPYVAVEICRGSSNQD
ncbi:MAG: dihydroneopterin aldolase [Candidatus Poribacteria bacterium]|nr:dihydroneopterin aldolase [Candidatus Poribacteria bacterium]